MKRQKDLAWQMGRAIGKLRRVGGNTAYGKSKTIDKIARDLKKQGIQDIRNIKTKHVDRLVEHLKEDGLKAHCIAPYLTIMREVAQAIGKPNIVHKDNRAYGVNRPNEIRYNPQIRDNEKYQTAKEKLAATRPEWMSRILEFGEPLGLRRNEMLMTRDVARINGFGQVEVTRNAGKTTEYLTREQFARRYCQGAVDKYLDDKRHPIAPGVWHVVVEFAKGGLSRLIPVDTPQKNQAVRAHREWIRSTGHKSAIPAELTAEQGKTAFKNALYRCGFTRENEANVHRNRPAFVASERAAGKVDYEISKGLGHGRIEILACYDPR